MNCPYCGKWNCSNKCIAIVDVYGEPLLVGFRVAYNYQGEVRIGTIVKVVETNKRDRKGFVFHVEMEKTDSRDKTRISKVSRRTNLVVIPIVEE